jgi:hypothetical protein
MARVHMKRGRTYKHAQRAVHLITEEQPSPQPATHRYNQLTYRPCHWTRVCGEFFWCVLRLLMPCSSTSTRRSFSRAFFACTCTSTRQTVRVPLSRRLPLTAGATGSSTSRNRAVSRVSSGCHRLMTSWCASWSSLERQCSVRRRTLLL